MARRRGGHTHGGRLAAMGGWVALRCAPRTRRRASAPASLSGGCFGLYVSAAYHDLMQLSVHAGVTQCPLGDDL
eukprot:5556257-Prymnesium_polylepis.1